MTTNSPLPDADGGVSEAAAPARRRMPNYVQIADAYIFQQTIDDRLKQVGVTQAREDSIRLAGVQWIDHTRKALKLPVRTFDTAVIYYHKFRLVHSDGEYSFVDAAAASLFAACKIEDTLKKSRDILCAAHNLKVSRGDQLSPDDPVFEHQSRTIIGLERLMLEASGFDFRNRHPQHLLIKLAKFYSLHRQSRLVRLAYKISLDLYRTFAPLKQCTATLAYACLELAGRIVRADGQPQLDEEEVLERMEHERERDYQRWGVSRGPVMETLLDLLELYTHYRTSTLTGPLFAIDAFLEARIPLNEELSRKKLPRFTVWIDTPPRQAGRRPGTDSNNNHSHHNYNHRENGIERGRDFRGAVPGSSGGMGRRTASPRDGAAAIPAPSPSTALTSGAGMGNSSAAATSTPNGGVAPNGSGVGGGATNSNNTTTTTATTNSTSAAPPAGSSGPASTSSAAGTGSATAAAAAAAAGAGSNTTTRPRIGERGRDGTVRFMLNPDRNREERAVIAEYGLSGD